MAEAATALGIASFGIQVCQGLVSYYGDRKDYYSDIQNTRESVEDLLETFELLSSYLRRPQIDLVSCKRVEESLKTCTGSLTALENELKTLQKYKDPKTLRQKARAEIQRAWYPFRADTLSKLRGIASELKQNLSLALDVLQIELGSSTKKVVDGVAIDAKEAADRTVAIETSVAKISEQTQRIEDTQQSQQWRNICNWLSAPDPWTNHDSHRKRHEPRTGGWILQSDKYVRWKAGDIQHLWLYGKAGCGKSVLCSTLIEDIREHCKTAANSGYGAFYFTFSDNQKQSYPNLLRSLVNQLGWREPGLSMLLPAYQKAGSSVPPPEELEKALVASIGAFDEVYILLDAPDECPEAEDMRQNVLEGLEELLQHASNVRILMTSREVSDVREFTETLQSSVVSISTTSVDKDIQKWISSQLSKDRKLCKLDEATKTLIESTVSEKADGMFRWAYCQLQELKKLKSIKPKYVEHALSHLPATLDATYERMLTSIEDMYRNEALTCLKWLAFSQRPLTLAELAEAAIVDPEGDGTVDTDNRGDLEGTLAILGALIVVQEAREDSDKASDSDNYGNDDDDYHDENGDDDDHDDNSDDDEVHEDYDNELEENETVEYSKDSLSESLYSDSSFGTFNKPAKIRLAHFSVKEYLESERILKSDAEAFHMENSKAHRFLAQSCLTYLIHYSNNEKTDRKDRDFKEFPLLEYAATSWYGHSSLQCGEVTRETSFLGSTQIRFDWIQAHNPDLYVRYDSRGSSLYYASLLGLGAVVEQLLKAGANVSTEGGGYGSALQAASRNAHEGVVLQLLSAGADVNMQGGYYGNALQAASRKGSREIVKILIDAGADVNAQGGYYGSALQAASAQGYATIVEKLIDARADVNAKRGVYGTPLIAASISGFTDIVDKLIRAGADVNAKGESGFGPALHAASYFGHASIIDLLISAGADLNAQGKCYSNHGTALELASRRGNTDMVDKLLRAGATPLPS